MPRRRRRRVRPSPVTTSIIFSYHPAIDLTVFQGGQRDLVTTTYDRDFQILYIWPTSPHAPCVRPPAARTNTKKA